MDDQPEPVPAPTFSIPLSTLLPSIPPVRLAHSVTDNSPKISSTSPLSLITTPAPSSIPSTSSGFECLHSAMDDQPEPEPASLSLIALISPALPLTPLPAHLSTDDDFKLATAPLSSSSILLPTPASVRLETDNQPKSKPASTSSIPLSMLLPSASPTPSHTPSLTSLSTDEAWMRPCQHCMDTYTSPKDQGQPTALTAAFTGHMATCTEECEAILSRETSVQRGAQAQGSCDGATCAWTSAVCLEIGYGPQYARQCL